MLLQLVRALRLLLPVLTSLSIHKRQGLSTPFTVPILTRPFIFQSHATSARTDIYERRKFEVLNHRALCKATSSAGPPHSMLSVHSRLLSEAENTEFFMHKIWSACFVLNCRAPETVLDHAKVSLRLLPELLGQERALQVRGAVPKLEKGKVIEIKYEGEEAVAYEDPRPIKQSRRESMILLLSLLLYWALSRLLGPWYYVSPSGCPVASDKTSGQL